MTAASASNVCWHSANCRKQFSIAVSCFSQLSQNLSWKEPRKQISLTKMATPNEMSTGVMFYSVPLKLKKKTMAQCLYRKLCASNAAARALDPLSIAASQPVTWTAFWWSESLNFSKDCFTSAWLFTTCANSDLEMVRQHLQHQEQQATPSAGLVPIVASPWGPNISHSRLRKQHCDKNLELPTCQSSTPSLTWIHLFSLLVGVVCLWD